MKVSTRLALGFSTLALIGVCISAYSSLKMRSLATNLDDVANNQMVIVSQLTELKDNLNTIAILARQITINIDDTQAQLNDKNQITALRAANAKILQELNKSVKLPKAVAYLKVINVDRQNYDVTLDRAITLAQSGDVAEASTLLSHDVRALQDVVFNATDSSRALQFQLMRKLSIETNEAAGSASILLGGLALLTFAGAAVVGWFITHDLSRALGTEPADLSEIAGRVSDGDLSRRLQVRAGDSVSVLAAMARMQDSLIGVVSTVRLSSESVAIACAEIERGNVDLSNRTEQQASALQESATRMAKLDEMVSQNATSAREVDHLASKAAEAAEQGGEVVGQVVDTMKDISESSRKISDIIGVINDIAFQTNILALNAAVEAARAGEQGRGFAVVAAEVRSLAGRAAKAASEIASLIHTSSERVARGTTLVGMAGETMTTIVASVHRVCGIMGEISEASNEQAAGMAKIGEAVRSMDQVTQQNAALVEQIAAASSCLTSQAQDLVKVVSAFKLSAA